MTWFDLKRLPEQEVMDSEEEVEAYASAAAQAYLESIDRSFVDHVQRLLAPADGGRMARSALDFGCGPGQIPIMMARRWPSMQIIGLDASPRMVAQAREAAAQAGVSASFAVFRLGPDEVGERRLPYPDGAFDVVTCNSVLHHLADPLGTLDELDRVAKPGGVVLVRDLRRPSALAYPLHVRLFGRHYSGEMRRLFEASVRAAYTVAELQSLLAISRLGDGRARVFQRGLTHVGIERAALPGLGLSGNGH